jgi:hypothetical protein
MHADGIFQALQFSWEDHSVERGTYILDQNLPIPTIRAGNDHLVARYNTVAGLNFTAILRLGRNAEQEKQESGDECFHLTTSFRVAARAWWNVTCLCS